MTFWPPEMLPRETGSDLQPLSRVRTGTPRWVCSSRLIFVVKLFFFRELLASGDVEFNHYNFDGFPKGLKSRPHFCHVC